MTAKNVGYNGALATNGEHVLRLQRLVEHGSNPVPTAFALNGTACTGCTGRHRTRRDHPRPAPPPTHHRPTPPPDRPTGDHAAADHAGRRRKQVENLDRGLISVRSGSGNLVSWRLLGTEPPTPASTSTAAAPR